MKTVATSVLFCLALALVSQAGCRSRETSAFSTPTAAEATAKPRGKIIESKTLTTGRALRFDYYDVDEPDTSFKALTAQGLQGGGPTWEGIVEGLLQLRHPALLGVITFDAEGEGLAIWSDDRAALEEISHLVGAAKESPALLQAAIARGKSDGRME